MKPKKSGEILGTKGGRGENACFVIGLVFARTRECEPCV